MAVVFDRPLAESPEGWSASLDLVAKLRRGRTVLDSNRHCGPLRVQRPFYPEGGVCHVYILHPPGGLVAGDKLDIRVQCDSDAELLLTTPSAGRVYGSNQLRLEQSQQLSIRVEASARCEWLPQESIVFDRAEAVNRLSVSLAEGAVFTGWEITCLGRPASREFFDSGSLDQRWAIYLEDRPLLLETSRFVGGSAQLQAPWGLAGATVVGTLVTTCRETSPEQVREAIEVILSELALSAQQAGREQMGSKPFEVPLVAVSVLPELMVIRAFGQRAVDVKAVFTGLWRILRLAQTGQDAVAPRIWFT